MNKEFLDKYKEICSKYPYKVVTERNHTVFRSDSIQDCEEYLRRMCEHGHTHTIKKES
jgi:hypothetical protein